MQVFQQIQYSFYIPAVKNFEHRLRFGQAAASQTLQVFWDSVYKTSCNDVFYNHNMAL